MARHCSGALDSDAGQGWHDAAVARSGVDDGRVWVVRLKFANRDGAPNFAAMDMKGTTLQWPGEVWMMVVMLDIV